MGITYLEKTNSFSVNKNGKQITYSICKYGRTIAKKLAEKSLKTMIRYKNYIEEKDGKAIMYIYRAPSKQIFKVFIDAEDIEKVQRYKWYINIPQNSRTLYVASDKIGKLHRYILGETNPQICIDHIDRNGLNNQKKNLRKTSNSINKKNMAAWATSKTGINGVSYEPPGNKTAGRYRACWTDHEGKQHLKSFSVRKYKNAFELAVNFRKKMEQEFGYVS